MVRSTIVRVIPHNTRLCVYESIHTQYTYTIHLNFKTRHLSKFIITDEPQR